MDCFIEAFIEVCGQCCCEGGCELCGEVMPSSSRKVLFVCGAMMAVLCVGGLIMVIAGGVLMGLHPQENTGAVVLACGIALMVFAGIYFLIMGLLDRKKRKKLQAYIKESAQENIEQNQYRKGIVEQGAVQPSVPTDGQTEKEESDGKDE